MTLIPDLQRDLVDAAERWNGEQQRFGVWSRLTPAVVVVAVLIGVAVLLSSRDPSSQESSPGTPSERSPKPPSRRGPQPRPGSLSPVVRFEFAGVGYSSVGFRARSASRDGVICSRVLERRGGRGRRVVGATCAASDCCAVGSTTMPPAQSVAAVANPSSSPGSRERTWPASPLVTRNTPAKSCFRSPGNPHRGRGSRSASSWSSSTRHRTGPATSCSETVPV